MNINYEKCPYPVEYPSSEAYWAGHFAKLSQPERRNELKKYKWQYQRAEVPRCMDCNKVFFNCMCDDSTFTTPENRDIYNDKKANWKFELGKSFEEKLAYSESLVKRVDEQINKYNKKIYLAYSGGIDSETCLRLFKELVMNGKIKVTFANTMSELPDTYLRVREAEKEMGVKFIWTTPAQGMVFRTNAIVHGLPVYPRNSISKTSGDEYLKTPTKMCCETLKERPQALLQKDMDGIIMGLRADENQGRQWTVKKQGACFLDMNSKWRVRPIAYWTIEDEWKYQEKMGFKYNAIYDKTNINRKGFYQLKSSKLFQIRSGCAYCIQPIYGGYLEWLHEYYPKYYTMLKKTYDDVADIRMKEGKDTVRMGFCEICKIKKVTAPE